MRKIYRVTDAAVQLLLFTVWIWCVVKGSITGFYLYFIIGGWQILSLIIHFFLAGQKFQNTYRIFVKIDLWLAGILVSGIVLTPLLGIELWTLLFTAPLLAAAYLYNCIAEIIYLRKRPISYIK